MELFSVTQFFVDGSYETVVTSVPAAQAVTTVRGLITSLGCKLGTTQRVIITDEWDCTNFEWQYGKGVTFPVGE